MKIVFIRHGLTAGNLEKRYIGRTDEALCPEGIEQLRNADIPPCEVLVCSPMKRCLQSAQILFPQQDIITDEDLRECDFGDFEGKSYTELTGNAAYQEWIDSGGSLPFPGGESPQDFRKRCICAFDTIVRKYKEKSSVAFVVHGGTIMAVLERYAFPHRDYFDWHCSNGTGYVCQWNGSELEITERI